MAGTIYALIILFSGGMDGGRAINTDLRFDRAELCAEAAELINKTAVLAADRYTGYRVSGICVRVK